MHRGNSRDGLTVDRCGDACATARFALIHALDHGSDALTDANTHRGETVATAAFCHFMNQRRHDPRAAAAQRMAESYGAAIDVELVQIDAQLARAREHL